MNDMTVDNKLLIQELEDKLKEIWQEVFELPTVSIDDNFIELGGQSILATRIIARIYNSYGIELKIRFIFLFPTIRKFTAYLVTNKLIKNSPKATNLAIDATANLELSDSQKRFLFLSSLESKHTAYNIHKEFLVKGNLQLKVLEESILKLIKRHESLRTSFCFKDNKFIRQVQPNANFKLEFHQFNSAKTVKDIEPLAKKTISEQFDLTNCPLFRVVVYKITDETHVVLFIIHHIIADAWSINLILDELSVIYNAFIEGKYYKLDQKLINYGVYINWHQQTLDNVNFNKQLEYWKNQLSDAEKLLLAPISPQQPQQPLAGSQYFVTLSTDTYHKLLAIGSQLRTSLYIILLAAFKTLLYRYTRQKDISIGTVVSDRMRTEFENVIGLFENILVIRTKLSEDLSFHDLFHKVIKTSLDAFDNQLIPFNKVVENILPERDAYHNPFFDIMLIFDNTLQKQLNLVNNHISSLFFTSDFARLNLILTIKIINNTIQLEFEYNNAYFNANTIKLLSNHYINIINHIIEDNDKKLNQFTILSSKELQMLKHTSKVQKDITAKSIYQLIKHQADLFPEKTALKDNEFNLTYTQLLDQVELFSKYLLTQTIPPGSIIGVALDSSAELVIALLALQNCNYIYLPLDINLPSQRLAYTVNDTQLKYIITKAELAESLASFNLSLINIELSKTAKLTTKSLSCVYSTDNSAIAYIFYTSGSTEYPKGIACKKISVLNTLLSIAQTTGFSNNDSIVQLAPITFDISILEFLLPLIAGGTLVIPTSNTKTAPEKIIEVLNNHDITFMQATPTTWQMLVEYGWQGKTNLTIISGGDHLTHHLAMQLVKKSNKIWNFYGPTETTIWSACKLINSTTQEITIGKPIANTQFFILDDFNNLMPIGTIGHLCIGGIGIAAGYVNKGKLTNCDLITLPSDINAHTEVFRTGDLARLRTDGEFELFGRTDSQVKINGIRINLAEINHVLLMHPAIEQAIALVDKTATPKIIVFIKFFAGKYLSEDKLQLYLQDYFPRNILPSKITVIDKFPTTSHGKIDNNALLSSLDASIKHKVAQISHANNENQVLLNIWKELLTTNNININDNFFAKGGNSLIATQLASRLKNIYNCDIPVRAIFMHPTIEKLVHYLNNINSTDNPLVSNQQISSITTQNNLYELSYAQQRMLFMQLHDLSNPFYNLPIILQVTGKINHDNLEKALNHVVMQHEILRTSFISSYGNWYQKVHEKLQVTIKKLDFSHSNSTEKNQLVKEYINSIISKTFNLTELPLFRVCLLTLADNQHMLVLVFHHIIFDGWSLGIFMNHLAKAYNSISKGIPFALTPAAIQYKDYAHWQNALIKQGTLAKQTDYWLNRLKNSLFSLNLLSDYQRPSTLSFHGNFYTFDLNKTLTKKLVMLAKMQDATLFMVLITAFKVLLFQHCKQNELVIGCPVANRANTELENIIGFFVNILLIKSTLRPNMGFSTLLNEIKETTLDAFANQELPFDILVSKINPTRDPAHNPIIDVLFVMQNADHGLKAFDDLTINLQNNEFKAAKFDLLLSLIEEEDLIKAKFEYNTDIFAETTIVNLANHYITLLDSIVSNPHQTIASYNLLNKLEEKHLLALSRGKKHRFQSLTISQRFTIITCQFPNKIAIEANGSIITYHELNKRSNYLAKHLQLLNVKAGDLIGICQHNLINAIISMLGILKADGCYLPIDQGNPSKRVKYIIDDAKPAYILVDNDFSPLFINIYDNSRLIDITSVMHNVAEDYQDSGINSNCPAYVMYTSGTTGKPKGVQVSHHNIYNLALNTANVKIQPNHRLAHTANLAFDASTFEIWSALLNGATIVDIEKNILLNPSYFKHFIQQNNITILWLTSAIFNNLIDTDSTMFDMLAYLIIGGDKLKLNKVKKLFTNKSKTNLKIINGYGPTECTVFSTFYEITPAILSLNSIPIGNPIDNVETFILDEEYKLVPSGIIGELYISGAGLTHGYLNDKTYTSKRFIEITANKNDKLRLFKTGDLARWNHKGEIEFISRIDEQVKIRGYRVDLNEISLVLESHQAVSKAYVKIYEDSSYDKKIVAYYIPKNTTTETNHLLANWNQIFDDLYTPISNLAEPENLLNDFSGWVSSYNQLAIPNNQMLEWLDNIISQISLLNPSRILEIGCGSGLLTLRLAPTVELYKATDISSAAINLIKQKIEKLELKLTNLQLVHKPANDFDQICCVSYDTVILNSVVQYFPNTDYLTDVIKKSISCMSDNGFIFIGDIRNLSLITAFHTSIIKHKFPNISSEETKFNIINNIKNDYELLVHPYFFVNLKKLIPEISHITVLLKRGKHHNEMTKYRYDVIFYIKNSDITTTTPTITIDWQQAKSSIESIPDVLKTISPPNLLIKNITNKRVIQDVLQAESILENKELKEFTNIDDALAIGIDPEHWYGLEKATNYEVTIHLSIDNPAKNYHVLLKRRDEPANKLCIIYSDLDIANSETSNISNIAPSTPITSEVLKQYLIDYLPEYMIPTLLIPVDNFPITSNGKIDSEALPAPSSIDVNVTPIDINSDNSAETIVKTIWAKTLNNPNIQIDDNFFNLGGDSIIIMQIISKAREYNLSITPKQIYQFQTIRSLANELSLQKNTNTAKAIVNTSAQVTINNLEQPAIYEPFPFTELQEAYWLGRKGLYNLGNMQPHFYMEFNCQNIDVTRLNTAWNKLLQRHEMLRIKIISDTQQTYWKYQPYTITVNDLRKFDSVAVNNFLLDLRQQMVATLADHDWAKFEIRVSLFNNDNARIHFSFDLIIADRTSLNIILNEWAKFYYNLDYPLPDITYTFKDYIFDYSRLKQSIKYQQDYKYWQEKLVNLPSSPALPLANNKQNLKYYVMKRLQKRLAEGLWRQAKQTFNKYNLSPSMVLCRAFADILAIWSNQEIFTFNVLYNPRSKINVAANNMVGCCSTTLLLPIHNSNDYFYDKCLKLQEQFFECMEHDSVSGLQVLRMLNQFKQTVAEATMPVVFSSGLRGIEQLDYDKNFNFLGKNIFNAVQTPYVLLDHIVYEIAGELIIDFDVVEEAFPEGMIQKILETYYQYIIYLAENSSRLTTLKIEDFYRTYSQATINIFKQHKLTTNKLSHLHDGFLSSVKKFPNNIAIQSNDYCISYAELNLQVNKIAKCLLMQNNYQSELIAIIIDKNWQQTLAALSISIAGHAYLPIDPTWPNKRINLLLKLCNIKIVITTKAYSNKIDNSNTLTILDIENTAEYNHFDTNNIEPVYNPSNLAYAIFTSGSTGTPKGVMITHQGACNTIEDMNKRISINSNDRVFGISPFSFDLSVYDIFGTLAAGATLILPPADYADNVIAWLNSAIENNITIWNSVPALFDIFIDYVDQNKRKLSLKAILLSGDSISINLIKRAQKYLTNAKIFCLGGATEASIWSTCYEITNNKILSKILYGRALTNQIMYVLNKHLLPCPYWVTGEIYIGGQGLALGYWQNEQITAKQFIIHPITGERLYKTGDLGRLLPDGNIEFLGREDNQVKIRGFRVELGEIESVLKTHKFINNCVVLVNILNNIKQLYAFIILNKDAKIDESGIQDFLSKLLPRYMLPDIIIFLDKLPLTANNKIDRQYLLGLIKQKYQRQTKKNPIIMDNAAAKVLAVWEEYLAIKNIDIEDNYFELGGDSITAIKILTRLQQLFNVNLTLNVLFRTPTVKYMVDIIKSQTANVSTENSTIVIPITINKSVETTIWLVHPIGGTIFCYNKIAKLLNPAGSVVGIQTPNIHSLNEFNTLSELAAYYINELRRHQPNGPYILGGWSFGGILAFEMARLLKLAGASVSKLYLIDADPITDNIQLDEISIRKNFIRDIIFNIDNSNMLPNIYTIHSDLNDIISKISLSSDACNVQQINSQYTQLIEQYKIFHKLNILNQNHKLESYTGNVTLFLATGKKVSSQSSLIKDYWLSLIKNGLTIKLINSDHFGIIKEPYIIEIANKIISEINLATLK